ncbi:hypothetical protein [Aurantimonas marina]|uniref:hypothetical protein n=1 Tax=Aurantimonas marina TaxID=2780508 RepID=UPI0019D24126|nr:hypothetical protein [Aurantimonas marina]
MPKRPAPAPPADEPPTPEEIAASQAMAREHMEIVRRALLRAGWRQGPRRQNLRSVWQAIAAGTASQAPGHSDARILAGIAQRITPRCRRPECRRAFTCRHGTRADEKASGGFPPCFAALPQVLRISLHFALARLCDPAAFRDGPLAHQEEAMLRAAQQELAEPVAPEPETVASRTARPEPDGIGLAPSPRPAQPRIVTLD